MTHRSDAAAVHTGTTLGRYRIERLIAHSTSGALYIATYGRFDRRVALKVLAPELAADPSFRERFARDAPLLTTLDHPHAVPVYETGEADGRLFVAMRLLSGINLAGLLSRRGRLTPGTAASIAVQAARALDAAHRLGLVHGNLKPASVLVTGGAHRDGWVYLTGFALGRTVSGGAEADIPGVAYLAPERRAGAPADAPADVFSLGAILFEALTGHLPFDADSAHKNRPRRATSLVRELPAAVDDILLRALSPNPADRHLSAGSLGEAIRLALMPGASAGAKSVGPGTAAVGFELNYGTTPGRMGAAPAPEGTGDRPSTIWTRPGAQPPRRRQRREPSETTGRRDPHEQRAAVARGDRPQRMGPSLASPGGRREAAEERSARAAAKLGAEGAGTRQAEPLGSLTPRRRGKPLAALILLAAVVIVIVLVATHGSATHRRAQHSRTRSRAHRSRPRAPASSTASLQGAGYTATYPANWRVTQRDQRHGPSIRTVLQSANGAEKVTIDRTPGSDLTPLAQAQAVVDQLGSAPGYQLVTSAGATLAGSAAYELVYSLPTGTNIEYFRTVNGDDYAVLGNGRDIRHAASSVLAIAASIR